MARTGVQARPEFFSERTQVRGIIFCVDAEAEDDVIAGAFAFNPEPPAEDPKQGIEPVHRPSEFREHLHQPIEAFDMGKLMNEDNAQSIVRPGLRLARK
jgi:hypothetical protein